MGYTLNYHNLRDPQFMGAFMKLASYSAFPTKTAIKIAKIKKALDQESELAQGEFIKILKTYAELDEAGNIKPHDGVHGTFNVTEEKKAEWLKALKEFESVTFDVNQSKLNYEELTGCAMSPNDIIALDPILTEGPEIHIANTPELII